MPDLKSELQKVAPILGQKPLIQRIWEYIRDKPDRTSKDVVSHFSADKPNSVRRVLFDLFQRGMLVSKIETRSWAIRPMHVYRASPSMHGVYELLPVVKKPKAVRASKAGKPVKVVPHSAAQAQQPPVQVQPEEPTIVMVEPDVVDDVMSKLNVYDAHKLYLKLQDLFGGRDA